MSDYFNSQVSRLQNTVPVKLFQPISKKLIFRSLKLSDF